MVKQNARTRDSGKRRNPSQKPEGKTTSIISFKEGDIAQRWLLTAEGCPTCAQIKRDMKKEFASGKIKGTDVGDDKGFEILTTLGITEAPMFVIELSDAYYKSHGIRYVIDE